MGMLSILAAGLIVSFHSLFFKSDAKEWSRQSSGVYQLVDGTTISGVVARGIDVSHWQGKIDWKAVAADDVKFVMLGTRSQGRPDPTFDYNAKSAYNEGIALGAYIYSYATTVSQAEAEADFVLNLIKDYPISYPIAFDAEDEQTLGKLPKSQIAAIILAFTKKIRAAGYYPIIYANDYWIASKLDLNALAGIDIWVARYNKKHAYANPVMWQATETGKVNGIKGNVDIDFQYKDFSSVIPRDITRTIAGKTYTYKNYVLQTDNSNKNQNNTTKPSKDNTTSPTEPDNNKKNTPAQGWNLIKGKYYYYTNITGRAVTSWFKVDNKWYFFNQDGVMQTGWLNKDNRWYYLEASGAMVSGWIKVNNIYYYFDASGAMATGWVSYNSIWYYLDDAGAMATGWLNKDNCWYLLADSGAMTTGWAKLNNVYYYFDNNGVMKTGWITHNAKQYYLGDSGELQTGWLNKDNRWYLLEAASGMMVSGWAKVDNIYYYFDSSGIMQTGWLPYDSAWYYMEASGAMATGYRTINGKGYYFDNNGIMLSSTNVVHEGSVFAVDANGVMSSIPLGKSSSPEGTRLGSEELNKIKAPEDQGESKGQNANRPNPSETLVETKPN